MIANIRKRIKACETLEHELYAYLAKKTEQAQGILDDALELTKPERKNIFG